MKLDFIVCHRNEVGKKGDAACWYIFFSRLNCANSLQTSHKLLPYFFKRCPKDLDILLIKQCDGSNVGFLSSEINPVLKNETEAHDKSRQPLLKAAEILDAFFELFLRKLFQFLSEMENLRWPCAGV